MSERKTICFLTAVPESVHANRLASGIFEQCQKYGYNVAVFSAMISPDFFFREYAEGEMTIYDLPDFSRFDGIVIDVISLVLQNRIEYAEMICQRIKEHTDAPVVGVGIPIGDIRMVRSDNDLMFRELCRHAVNVHGCKEICLLTGQKGNPEAESRLAVMLDELAKLGLQVRDEHIIYGDFWYFSGQKLADDILSGKISMPDAVIASSDHMALGLMEELRANDVRVPEDIRVLGFEATQEALLNSISLTTIESNFAKCAADAVDIITAEIEPGKEIIPYQLNLANMLHLGKSCGCKPDIEKTLDMVKSSMYFISKNYSTDLFQDNIDIGMLMESYIPEKLTASQTPDECISNLYDAAYILAPYENIYLCMCEDWLDMEVKDKKGYTDRMKLVMRRSKECRGDHCSNTYAKVFSTKEMLPEMFEDSDIPYVFYFSPMHFGNYTLGYSVLQRKLSDKEKINLVYRNWLRFANNALEMVRSKHHFVDMSFHDKMTGLLNRRGMQSEFEKMRKNASPEDKLFVCVIDMDRLKYINDTFGHQEGDEAIKTIGDVAASITDEHELCVRAGGDEFYIIGIGPYDDIVLDMKKERFYQALKKNTERLEKPYAVTASIGAALSLLTDDVRLDSLILEADEAMYYHKILRKMNDHKVDIR
ncbi:GGDEF domain-containing protein [Ruminococcus albus]|uniref:Diguanylate cyclase (GGDEF) domain-containing protein n=1 Tax=Ruminococcus albus TaxID=1264 RepID=A0A1I1F740_RUMAL|nr:GGDEF domain-containing protein [Ruminococcus albus]SFB95117.1 diguanylate cyclase (GGDEF) domain-containing protein [Ruminococcus albus]